MKLTLEIEVLPGLENLLIEEGREKGIRDLSILEKGKIATRWSEQGLHASRKLRIATSSHFVLSVPGRKPGALRGDEALRTFQEHVMPLRTNGGFNTKTFRLSFHGSVSSEGERLREAISSALQLEYLEELGEQLFRVRKSAYCEGWDIVVRTTGKPLSVRSWRVANYRGALNANIAAAMIRLIQPDKNSVVLDPFCGSGTLLFELMETHRKTKVIGGDISRAAIHLLQKNGEQISSSKKKLFCYQGNAEAIPFCSGKVSHICSNLPWGEKHGEKSSLQPLYKNVLEEMQRTLAPGGQIALITQATAALENALASLSSPLEIQKRVRVHTGTFSPSIYILV